MIRTLPVATILLATLTSVATAKPTFMSQGYLSGQDVLHACSSVVDRPKRKSGRSLSYFCSGYVLGFSSAEAALQADSDIYGIYQKAFCLPESASQLDVVRGVHQALSTYPVARLNQPASLLMKPAFIKAFPCAMAKTKQVEPGVERGVAPQTTLKAQSQELIGEPPASRIAYK